MKFVLALSLLFSSLLSFSQKMFDEEAGVCPLKFLLEDQEAIVYYETGDSLMVINLLQGLEEKYTDRLKGVVMMQVMVDTAFQACLVSYTNKTTLSDRRFNIPEQFGKMTGWKRLDGVLPNENICALVSIVFDKEDYVIIRTGYNRNKGRQQLDYETFRRYLPVVKDSTQTNTQN
ncbi:MAG: hypothetical protein AB7S69_16375 [Salinivirgaceae bacterium]